MHYQYTKFDKLDLIDIANEFCQEKNQRTLSENYNAFFQHLYKIKIKMISISEASIFLIRKLPPPPTPLCKNQYFPWQFY